MHSMVLVQFSHLNTMGSHKLSEWGMIHADISFVLDLTVSHLSLPPQDICYSPQQPEWQTGH